MSSVFLEIPPEEWVDHNAHAFAIRDRYPVTRGHTLVITRELVATWFEASKEQQLAVLELVDRVKVQLDEELHPSGYNVGFNAGASAGQTVPHLHVHVIPRYEGDHEDPRGGVRNVIPERGNYKRIAADWKKPPGPESSKVARARILSDGEVDRHLHSELADLFRRASDALVIASFVKGSGVDLLEGTFRAFLRRGGRLELVTGDYLNITQATALQRLHDLEMATRAYAAAEEQPEAAVETDVEEDDAEAAPVQGSFELKVVKNEDIERAFHPKAYVFAWGTDPRDGVAYVGSSNLSKSALARGVEWNLRIERCRDPGGWDEVYAAAKALWRRASKVDEDWITAYRARARASGFALPPWAGDEDGAEDEGELPEPREIQEEALVALAESRGAGHRRALVVLATGLGKTYLAAFDVQRFSESLGRPLRVLIVAHRRELLTQALRTFRHVLPDARFSWCAGASSDLGGDVVLASIQKLARMDLSGKRDHFDYVIVDEVHHAAAHSYKVLFEQLQPAFLLGLTATPERADEGDVVGLFDDNVPYRADLARGISTGALVPFVYEGIKDPVDYAPIPWRNGKFESEQLEQAIQTQARMDTLWDAWERLPGTRNLVFCVSIAHARFVSRWLEDKGVRIACVHSGPDSDDRADALRKLEQGKLDAIATVDLFNEGIDCKPIDRVVMLRPTASPVVFLQQLGRGLRTMKDETKTELRVLDFVGNHHSFLNRLRVLLSLAESPPSVRDFVRNGGKVDLRLPEGCSVDIELEAIELLGKLLPKSSTNELVRVYRELRTSRGVRPTAGELFRRGLNPASVPGTWFEFVDDEGDLSADEEVVFHEAGSRGKQIRSWLADLERSSLSKSFKMVLLDVVLDRGALGASISLEELAFRCHDYLLRTPALFRDIENVKAVPNPRELASESDRKAWLAYWKKNPIAAWTKASKSGTRPWFSVEGQQLVSHVPVPEEPAARASFEAMTWELVDLQLARYRRRLDTRAALTEAGEVASFTMKVLRNPCQNPILHFGNQKHGRDRLPKGETDVRLEDGSIWGFRFVKIACNVARPVGEKRNKLPDLLRRWFGPDAGKPGTDFHVEFRRAPEGWWVAPLGGEVISLSRARRRDHVIAYPSLRAAAGHTDAGEAFQGETVEGREVHLPLPRSSRDIFVVRATGNSMAGGTQPIHNGDWVAFEWARHRGLEAVAGRIALVAVGEPDEDRQFLIKRVVRTDDGIVLRSENRTHPDLFVGPHTQVLAIFVTVVRPEQLAPTPGVLLANDQLVDAFALSQPPKPPHTRVDGHLFVLIDRPGRILDPDRARVAVPDRGPGETAFILTRSKDSWRYAGVGRWSEADGAWIFPAVDHRTSKELGDGSVSRRLDERWLERARAFTEGLRPGEWVEARGKRCRVVRKLDSGGVRIDGGDGGFKARNVSASDLGWVLKARELAAKVGGVVDEARVNRLRYLDGTPKGSTRWIDTGWALVLTEPTP